MKIIMSEVEEKSVDRLTEAELEELKVEQDIIILVMMNRFSDDMPTSSKIKFDDISDDDDEEAESASDDDGKNEVYGVFANVAFEELQKARLDGSHVINQKPKLERKGKREHINRPMEISSKKPVGRIREVIQPLKKVICDPRFEFLCGALDVDGFKKRYNFLYECELPDEKKRLKEQMERTKDPEVLDGLKVVDGFKKRVAWIDKQLKISIQKCPTLPPPNSLTASIELIPVNIN
uniref:LOW QUALITY PROTEIN: rRNA biogenesis protein rrp36-like n=1 Tax=Erigeron canadensis TaxID=72917 RepID=UPI001CB9193B|nr:LOW QUALITY PROTEIN: rRNA biogenesis protein rrp36-like [Erigeron canadensis]